jgi:predicted DNA-binding transcriptional regulator AlpA
MTAQPDRLVTFPELKSEFGIKYCRMSLYRKEAAGTFPLRISLSSHSVAWSAREIQAWIAEHAAARDAGHEAMPEMRATG